MFFAVDGNGRRVHIDDACGNIEYYCDFCGEPMIIKRGDIRRHHFAHTSTNKCETSRDFDGDYSSDWHCAWQNEFPKENREIKLLFDNVCYRTDVMVDKTVLELQHSTISKRKFSERNSFYFNLGCRVVWLFDMEMLLDNGKAEYTQHGNRLYFEYKELPKTFSSYDVKTGTVDLYFQLSSSENACVARVTDINNGCFTTSLLMSKVEFLSMVGLKDGTCLPPFLDFRKENEDFKFLREKLGLEFNSQQERAIQAVNGNVMVVAVPGSGKTTVLLTRIVHMIKNMGVSAKKILVLTYNKKICDDLKLRFENQFAQPLGIEPGVKFATLNGICCEICRDYWNEMNKKGRRTVCNDSDIAKMLREIYKSIFNELADNETVSKYKKAISYAKNMMLDAEALSEMESSYPNFAQVKEKYDECLKEKKKMDFDDQLVFAHMILTNKKTVQLANKWKRRFDYICVDEAQDLSKIQHELIRLLCENGKIYITGDEDQCIYSFRGAYPDGIYDFKNNYGNTLILKMEHNYRSCQEITDAAQNFISKNEHRHDKSMISVRRSGGEKSCISVSSQEEQYLRLSEIAKVANGKTAFLYRDNESGIALADLFLREKIPFVIQKGDSEVLSNREIRHAEKLLRAITNNGDCENLNELCEDFGMKEKQISWAVGEYRKTHNIVKAIGSQSEYCDSKTRSQIESFCSLAELNLKDTIGKIKHEKESDKYDILLTLAERESDKGKFLNRISFLRENVENKCWSESGARVILSTIHQSKGIEYDSVYMVDVFDGKLPSCKKCRGDIYTQTNEEDRRLLYVGMTRAKNSFHMFGIANKPSQYVDEIFPEERLRREAEKRVADEKHRREEREHFERETAEREKQEREIAERLLEEKMRRDAERAELERRAREDDERKRMEALKKEEEARECERKAFEEFKESLKEYNFNSEKPLYFGNMRYAKCTICGMVNTVEHFAMYRGCLGKCNKCF